MRGLFLLMLAGFFMSGCGVKPTTLQPPESDEVSDFPHHYPDLKTDPEPSE